MLGTFGALWFVLFSVFLYSPVSIENKKEGKQFADTNIRDLWCFKASHEASQHVMKLANTSQYNQNLVSVLLTAVSVEITKDDNATIGH